MDKLLLIITGPEHNGTTVIEKILYSHPDIFGGFETGLLLNPFFSECKPFNEWIYMDKWHWGIPNSISFSDDLTFNEKYSLLYKHKGSHNDDIQKIIRNSKFIVDKTPAYIRNLKFVRKNTPLNIPIVISIKKFLGYYNSYIVKRKGDLQEFIKLVEKTMINLIWLKDNINNNIYLFDYDDIIKNEKKFSEKIKQIIKFKVNINLDLSIDKYNKKIENVNKNDPEPYHGWKKNKDDDNIIIPNDLIELHKLYDNLIENLKIKF